jgi:hypothetical protein
MKVLIVIIEAGNLKNFTGSVNKYVGIDKQARLPIF